MQTLIRKAILPATFIKILSALLLIIAQAFAAQLLRPTQQAALETILGTVDPQMRPMMREQLTQTLSVLDDAQIKMLLDSMDSDGAGSDESVDVATEESVVAEVSAEDLEFNRRQYEPPIREAWAASHAFDAFVDSELAANCGTQRTFAIYGSGWRYEVMPLAPVWPRASKSADLDAQMIGVAYTPQDGRYDFDFSAMSTEFDRASLSHAIANACREYLAIGQRFLDANGGRSGDAPPPDGMRIESAANAEVQKINLRLETELQRWPNGWISALYAALISAEPVG